MQRALRGSILAVAVGVDGKGVVLDHHQLDATLDVVPSPSPAPAMEPPASPQLTETDYMTAEHEADGWCPQWKEASSTGVGLGKSYFKGVDKKACFGKCDADPTCQQAKWEQDGPHGEECWIGNATMTSKPTYTRPACAKHPGCTDTCYNRAGWYPKGKVVVLEGWCKDWQEGSSKGVGAGLSFWESDAITQEQCIAKCIADPICQQAKFEANGPHGNECWIGTNKMNAFPTAGGRSACKAHDGCADFCFSKGGWYPDHKPRVLEGWCTMWEEGSSKGVGGGKSYFHGDATTQAECIAKCDVDEACTQAKFEAHGPHGNECWLGVHPDELHATPGPSRPACTNHTGCMDLCYSKAGFIV